MSAEIGRVLGGRYRLIAPIGMGASAQVYLADDVRLRRRVALKMLHDALAGDEEFLRRFRAEARAAAALSHPNVMAVYDWGDDDTAFIVTEFLGGGSLRGLLDESALLTPSQALVVGLEAARALDYAHRRGFVHRDIKPANLLFGDDQRLRIADFGLARALAEAAWTEPQGAMLGTARYASPEQAKGEQVNGKADVYALALVLVEAVTGEVPFAADTTIGTLMARVDRPLVVPDTLGALQRVLTWAGHPDPEERIDARALAAGLLRAAKELPRPAPLALAGALDPDGAAVQDRDPTVHGPDADGDPAPPDLTDDDLNLDPPDWVNQADPAALVAGAVVAGAVGDPPVVDDRSDDDGLVDDHPGGGPDDDGLDDGGLVDDDPGDDGLDDDGGPVGDVEPGPGPVDELSGDEASDDEGDIPTEETPAVDGPTGAALAGVLGGALDMGDVATVTPSDAGDGGYDSVATGIEPEPVPEAISVRGGPHRSAPHHGGPETGLDHVDDSGGVDDIEDGGHDEDAHDGDAHDGDAYDGDAYDGDAYDGDDGGRRSRRRRWPWVALVLVVLVAGGGAAAAATIDRDPPPPVVPVVLPVPDLTARAQDTAESVAAAAGWKTTVVTERRDDTLKGEVLATDPASGVRLARGQSIELLVSAGQTEVDVPTDLARRSLADATAALQAVGLDAETTGSTFDEDVPEGDVIAIAEATPTKLEKGSTVGLVLSDGPEPRTVPSGIVGNTEDGATQTIEALGLKVAVNRQFNDDVDKGTVISQSPEPGEKVERGATVTIKVSRGPELVTVPSGLVGNSEKGATEAIEALGLKVAVNRQFNDDVDTGKVASQIPGSGDQVQPGATVTIEVSRGPKLVAVPDVSGADTPAGAAAILRKSGLVPGKVSGSAEGTPSTDPAAGTEVRPGATVGIVLG